MAALKPTILQPQELLQDRPFTHPRHTHFDARLLRYLILRLCRLFESDQLAPTGREMATLVDHEADGRQLRQIVVQPDLLGNRAEWTVVGFFGQRRIEAVAGPLNHGDTFLVSTLNTHDGLLSYSTIELTCGNFANCVLFTSEEAKNDWGQHPDHARLASELSPHYYTTVRIYNGRLRNGLNPTPDLRLSTVKYFDFTDEPPWRALRQLTSGSSNNHGAPR